MSRSPVFALILLFAACDDGDGSSQPVDAPGSADAPRIDARIVDAPMIDAPMIDAPPAIDAPPGSAALACMHTCDALGVCFGEPSDAECYADCGADLADCSAQQIADVETCATQACGDISMKNSSPIFMCLASVACIEM